MSARRAERRRMARADLRTVYVGDSVAAAPIAGATFEATGRRELEDKQPGVHRWIVTAAWVVTDVEALQRSDDGPFIMDNENLHYLGVGCYDCEAPLGDGTGGSVTSSSVCPS